MPASSRRLYGLGPTAYYPASPEVEARKERCTDQDGGDTVRECTRYQDCGDTKPDPHRHDCDDESDGASSLRLTLRYRLGHRVESRARVCCR